MARRTIPMETKTAVLAAAQVEGADLKAIAQQFSVSLPTVYNYLKQARTVASLPVETVQA